LRPPFAANRFEDATMRQFQSASGRTWQVMLAPADNPDNGNQGDVLRFWSPGLKCDLRDWPADWDKLPEPTLITLLDKALTDWVSQART
jgi:hypothetical protein